MQQLPKNTHGRSFWIVWARRLLHLYPACWQARYADEMLAILEEHSPTFWTLVDLFLSLCDAYLHYDLVSGKSFTLVKQFYNSVTTILSVGLLFSLLSSALGRDLINMAQYETALPPFFQLVVLALNNLASVFAILLVLFGGSILLFAGRQVLKTDRTLSFFLYLFAVLCPTIACIAILTTNASLLYFIPFSLFPFLGACPLIFFSLLSVPIFCSIVGTGLWATKVALRQTVAGIRLTNFLLAGARLCSTLLFAYCIGLLFLVAYSLFFGFDTYFESGLGGNLGWLLLVIINMHQLNRQLSMSSSSKQAVKRG